jgi:hypothetical protein
VAGASAISCGASRAAPGQVGPRWEVRRIVCPPSPTAISDAILTSFAAGCGEGAFCAYGVGTHSCERTTPRSPLPAQPWRDLPAFFDDEPDHLPNAP